jgi:hypothetical protein
MTARFALLAAAVAVLGVAAAPAKPPVTFAWHDGTIALTGTTYRLALSGTNGRILDLVDRVHGTSVVREQGRCLWGALNDNDASYAGGCTARSFSAQWRQRTSTLLLRYTSTPVGDVTVAVRAQPTFVDLQLLLVHSRRLETRIRFPDGLAADVARARAGYAPNVLPGVRLGPRFFSGVRNDVQIYPSRWAFADYLALDEGRGNVAMYTVQGAQPWPAQLGFLRLGSGSWCAGATFCLFHEFETWVKPGGTWRSPVVRLRLGLSAEQSILDYRADNGIAAYPSLAAKLGERLPQLAAAPLLKADLARLQKPFAQWAADLQRLPAPVLLHPVAFTLGGHDASDPDFLPPDPRYGTTADFASMARSAHALGDLVMPYLNLSWWDPSSPTMLDLPPPLQTKDVAVLDEHGDPVSIAYGSHTGVIVSPYAPFVRERAAQELARWQTDVPADCLFLDQIGARPWLRDFNPASPNPEAYDDGWLAFLAQYRNRCVMVEDGWDRLARDAVGFHGSLLMMSRQLDLANAFYGAGNWEPYPLADWLFHDKVLMYEHDLYPGTMAADPEVLLWNAAFGFVESYEWAGDASIGDPWLELVSRLQQALGPHYAGVALSTYRTVAPNVTDSVFGDLDVLANWSAVEPYETDGSGLAPQGFFARSHDGAVEAGAFSGSFDGVALTPGTHYLIVERRGAVTTVRQPVGADTDVAVAAFAAAAATALAPDGTPLGTVPGSVVNGRFIFRYTGLIGGRRVGSFRIAAARYN